MPSQSEKTTESLLKTTQARSHDEKSTEAEIAEGNLQGAEPQRGGLGIKT